MTCVQVVQTKIYHRAADQKLSRRFRTCYLIVLSAISVTLISAWTGWVTWLDFFYLLGYIKLVGSFLKYLPQLYLNYKRQSTLGWSIENILLDLTGGILSISQLLLDSFSQSSHPWEGIKGNLAKLGLGLITFFLDVPFLIQHFYLYGSRPVEEADGKSSTETDRLLP